MKNKLRLSGKFYIICGSLGLVVFAYLLLAWNYRYDDIENRRNHFLSNWVNSQLLARNIGAEFSKGAPGVFENQHCASIIVSLTDMMKEGHKGESCFVVWPYVPTEYCVLEWFFQHCSGLLAFSNKEDMNFLKHRIMLAVYAFCQAPKDFRPELFCKNGNLKQKIYVKINEYMAARKNRKEVKFQIEAMK